MNTDQVQQPLNVSKIDREYLESSCISLRIEMVSQIANNHAWYLNSLIDLNLGSFLCPAHNKSSSSTRPEREEKEMDEPQTVWSRYESASIPGGRIVEPSVLVLHVTRIVNCELSRRGISAENPFPPPPFFPFLLLSNQAHFRLLIEFQCQHCLPDIIIVEKAGMEDRVSALLPINNTRWRDMTRPVASPTACVIRAPGRSTSFRRHDMENGAGKGEHPWEWDSIIFSAPGANDSQTCHAPRRVYRRISEPLFSWEEGGGGLTREKWPGFLSPTLARSRTTNGARLSGLLVSAPLLQDDFSCLQRYWGEGGVSCVCNSN
jgi:hypothetical protein